MHIPFKRILLLLLIPVVLTVGVPSICYANSPPPPAIFIIVPDAPKDLVLKIGSFHVTRKDKLFESYFGFGTFENKVPQDTVLQVTTGGASFDVAIPPLTKYSNTLTLDLRNKILTPGAPSFHAYEFAAITVVLTLLIEGIVFYFFGYRKKSSWLVFLVTNLITQGFLYFMLTTSVYPTLYNYAVFELIFGEILVFIIEIAAFLTLINEHHRLETFLYVIVANLVSLFAGGYLTGLMV